MAVAVAVAIALAVAVAVAVAVRQMTTRLMRVAGQTPPVINLTRALDPLRLGGGPRVAVAVAVAVAVRQIITQRASG